MDLRALALVLAVVGLGLGVVARWRARRGTSGSGAAPAATLLVPIVIIIGTLPGTLDLGETVKLVASVTSIIVSVIAIGALVRHTHRNRKA
jgi:hypothetical protein